MALVGLVAGSWFVVMGLWAARHPERVPDMAAGWMSTPERRRVFGLVTALVGAAAILLALLDLAR